MKGKRKRKHKGPGGRQGTERQKDKTHGMGN